MLGPGVIVTHSIAQSQHTQIHTQYTQTPNTQIPLVIRETCRKYQLILAHRLVAQKAKQ